MGYRHMFRTIMAEHPLPELPPKQIGEVDGTLLALVFDQPSRPRLTVEVGNEAVTIDVWAATVAEGDIPEPILSEVLAFAGRNADSLTAEWRYALDSALRESARKECVAELANYFDAVPQEQYDQTRQQHDDGTPACLLSHALAHFEPQTWDQARREGPRPFKERAARVLHIDYEVASLLYCGKPLGLDVDDPAPQEAAGMLRHLAETGFVRWERGVSR